jgi:DNA polymerase elongation subunit (family B)
MLQVNTSVKKRVKIAGKSYKLIDFHTYDEESVFRIQMFGISETGRTCSIIVKDYSPFFFVKVGLTWTDSDAAAFLRDIRAKVGNMAEDILSAQLVKRNKLYGFTGGSAYTFVQLTFRNIAVFNKAKGLWYKYDNSSGQRMRNPYLFKQTALELYESTIPPVLRFFHIYNISPSGWVSVILSLAETPETRTTTCDDEYVCSISHLRALPTKETLAPYKICSFDIEASSSHGDFPMPVKSYKRLASNMVDVFQKQAGILTDKTLLGKLLKRCILTAFGYDSLDDIDIVYPKTPVTKDAAKSYAEAVLKTALNLAENATIEEERRELLSISKMFEKIKETATVEDGGSDSDNDEADVEDEPVSTKNKSKSKPLPKTTTILDILLDENDRDTKIQKIDQALMETIQLPLLEGDKVTFIGSTFLRYGQAEPYLNHCLALGDCAPVAGADIQSCSTEEELLLNWTKLIEVENPDIIIGYNIFGFDYEFLYQRARENHCERDFFMLSRREGEITLKEDAKTGKLSMDTTKIALASGEYELRFPKIVGRLQIDLYAYFRRDFNLASYKLDDVAGQFISDDIKRIVHTDKYSDIITELWTGNTTGLHAGDFIHLEITGFTSDYFMNGRKFPVLGMESREVVENVKGKEATVPYTILTIAGHDLPENTKSIKWCMAKDDVTPQDIFRLSNGSPEDRAIVAKYCIQDCNLVHHLMKKIDVMTGYVEMAKICSVPISYLVFRGQGIKLTSYVAKKCREKNTLMPDLDKSGSNEGYEGAIVLPPKCSMYMDNPVACVDYASLYPSSMISQNYSHDSKVWTKEYDLEGALVRETGERDLSGNYIYDNLPGYQYINIEFDTYRQFQRHPKSRVESVKSGKKVCRWAQLPNHQKSIMPSILEELLKARADTRKLIKTEKDPFMQNILDKRQLGYKVTANSLYGQCGARTSTFYEKDVAASTTATGRMMITYARRMIEEVYGDLVYDTECHGPLQCRAEYVYGDSVTSYTPVYVRVAGKMDIHKIEHLAVLYGGGNWKPCLEEGKQEKEACELNGGVETWTERGWTPLLRVIRHQLARHKKIIRVTTGAGLVDVTDDHSLLLPNGDEVSPKETYVGTELMHHSPPPPILDSLSNQSSTQWATRCEPSMTVEEARELGREFRTGGYVIHQPIFSANKIIRLAFLEGYFIHQDIEKSNILVVEQRNQSSTQFIHWIASSLGWNTTIETANNSSTDVYRITIRKSKNDSTTCRRIRRMNVIDYGRGYVYDLTTANHHFASGAGNLIVHNTDSVFFTFNLEDPKTKEKVRGKKALEATIEIAQDTAQLCTQFLKAPMELAYEKTLMPFILLSKKRYVGMLYETDPNKGKLKYMGLSLKRRDACDYLKDTYGGVINILMKENRIEPAIQFLDSSLESLIQGRVPMDKLCITRALKSDYKNPQQIAHRVLADRIAKRDPGNKPKPGERMKFLFVTSPHKKALLGERIETPAYILDQGLQIDYTYYMTNQLMKPLQQLFGLAIEQIWEMQGKRSAIKTYKTDIAHLWEEAEGDREVYEKRREKLASTKVKQLLFDKFLNRVFNEKHGIRQITDFFGKK